MKLRLALCFTLLALPAMSQEAPSFTPEDEATMQQCFEAVRDIADGSSTQADCIGTATNICQGSPEGSSTPGIADCNRRETSWWDAQLNFYYEELQAKLAPDVFQSLRDAQRTWLAYRDAKCKFVYELWRDGTIRSAMQSFCILEETAHRSIELGAALDPQG